MRLNRKKRPNVIHMIHSLLSVIVLTLIVFLVTPDGVKAEEINKYSGILRGAACTHYKTGCPEDDAHIAIENDFVLVLPDGSHYFLPNLNRAIKARYANKHVRIAGEKEDHEIWVKSLEVKKDSKYQLMWNRKDQQKLYEESGG